MRPGSAGRLHTVRQCFGWLFSWLLLFSLAPVQAKTPVALENEKPGTADWRLRQPSLHHEIEGYATRSSVNRNEEISLCVNTTNSTYSIEIFRMGWYQGKGARRIAGPIKRPGEIQPGPIADPANGVIECNWQESYQLITAGSPDLPDGWPSGVYLARLTGDEDGFQSYIIFIVREDDRPADFFVQIPTATYQAYNAWGGKCFYDRLSSDNTAAPRVSFNRPYGTTQKSPSPSPQGVGAGDFLSPAFLSSGWDYNVVRWLEREGYDVVYGASEDTHSGRANLGRRKAFFSIGHDEYWSWGMRTHLEAARDQGVHIGIFSSNTSYWQVRFEPSPSTGASDRVLVCYKNLNDPIAGTTNSFFTTTRWRDVPVNDPESNLFGLRYVFNSLNSDIVMDQCDGWLTTFSNLKPGIVLPGLLGYEVDAIPSDVPFPVQRVAHSPFYIFDAKNRVYNRNYSDMAFHRAESGSLIFATGSMQWAWGLDSFGSPEAHLDLTNPEAQQMTRNLLHHFNGSVQPRVTFFKTASGAGGHWQGRYGADGFILPGTNSIPGYVQGFDAQGLSSQPLSEDFPGQLNLPGGTNNLPSIFSASPLRCAFDFGPAPRLITLYFADPRSSGAVQNLTISDPDTGEVLDQRLVALSSQGEFWTWSICGKVRIQLDGPNPAILNGLFFGGSAIVSFLDRDQQTHGNWKGFYGRDGAWICQGGSKLPAYAAMKTYGGQYPITVTNDLVRLQALAGTNLLSANGLFGDVELMLSGGEPHELALYFMRADSQPTGRVHLVDGLSNRVLDSRDVSTSVADQYLVWNVSGHLKIIVRDVPVSGLFLSPPKARPLVQLTSPTAASIVPAPASLLLHAEVSVPDALIDRVEFYNGGQLLAVATASPFEFLWTNVVTGHYELTALAYDSMDANGASDTVAIDISLPAGYVPPAISIALPTAGGAYEAPAAFTAACQITPGSSAVDHVDFIVDGLGVGQSRDGSYSLAGFSVGQHSLQARVVDQAGGAVLSSAVPFAVTMPRAQAAFLPIDSTTQGNWKGVYGSEGFMIMLDQTNLPPAALAASIAGRPFRWRDQTDDPRALQYSRSTSRVAAGWTGRQEVAFDISFADGLSHQLALYLLDWDGGGRAELISIYDADRNLVLDRQEVTDFQLGKYTVCSVRGSVHIRLSTESSGNAVFSALFLDRPAAAAGSSGLLQFASNALQNGDLEMTFAGLPGARYILDESTNLAQWMPIRTNSSPGGLVPFSAPQLRQGGAHFFRVRGGSASRPFLGP